MIAKLDAARQRLAKASGLVREAGYDGSQLARFLEHRGIDCPVMDPASLQMDHRTRRVKTEMASIPRSLIHRAVPEL